MNERTLTRLTEEEKDAALKWLLLNHNLAPLATEKKKRIQLSSIQDHFGSAAERIKSWGQLQGISSGIQHIDDLTKGFVPGELIVIGGSTSHGKTQLATNIATRIAGAGRPLLFVTLEMTKIELTSRIIKTYEPRDAATLPIIYQDSEELGYTDISDLVREAKERGAEIVFIDHLHYFVRSVEYASSEIGKITKEFKQAAIKNEIPIVLISHLRKMKKGEMPGTDDLRDSSFIGQDADVVLMIWRDLEDEENADVVTVKVTKNRNRGRFPGFIKRRFRSVGVNLQEISG